MHKIVSKYFKELVTGLNSLNNILSSLKDMSLLEQF